MIQQFLSNERLLNEKVLFVAVELTWKFKTLFSTLARKPQSVDLICVFFGAYVLHKS